MSASFVGVIQKLVANVAPWYVRRKNLGAFLEATGLTLDEAIESLGQGMRLGQPLRCDSSALPVLARDRGIRLYSTEPDASKRYRLSRWWQLHRQRGTHQGEMRHAQPYFLAGSEMPLMRIVHQDGAGARATWHSLDADGIYTIHKAEPSNWNYDNQILQFSRWFVILYAPADFLTMSFYDDGGVYDGGEFYDGILDTQVALDLVSMVQDWQGAHSMLWAYIITTDPTSFDPTSSYVADPTGWTSLPIGNWGQVITPAGVRTRPPYAHWIYDCAQGEH